MSADWLRRLSPVSRCVDGHTDALHWALVTEDILDLKSPEPDEHIRLVGWAQLVKLDIVT